MKVSITLGVIAALLLGFILIFERGTLGTREMEARQGSALPELIRDRVTKIEVQKKGVTTVLERNVDGTDEEALWHVKAPYQADADSDAIDTLLGDLEWLTPKRTLREVNAADLKKFGLEAPRYRLWFTVGSERIPLRVGTETPQHDGVYVTAKEPSTVLVVGKDLADSLGQPPEHYHTKTLHDGVLVATARKVEVRDAGGARTASRGPDGLWKVVEPAANKDMLAASAELTTVIEATDELKATRYVATDKAGLARYGLEPAQLELAIHKRGAYDLQKKGNDGPDVLAVRLRAGSPCEGQATERYITIGDAGVVFCAQNADIDKLKLPAEHLIETRLIPLDPRDIRGVRIQRGDRSLLVERVGGIPQPGMEAPWHFEQKRAGKVTAQGDARAGSVPDFFNALRAAEALPNAIATGSVQGSVFTATFMRDESKPDLVLTIALRGLDEALVQRGGEPQTVAFAPAAVELLDPSVAPFKDLTLLALNEAALRSLEISRGSVVEHIERPGAAAPYEITKPISAEADRIASSDVARLLTTLQTVRFVADAAEPNHGLDAPLLEVKAQLAGEGDKKQTISLQVGAATEGGSFARLGSDPAVFVVSTQLVDLLKAPLASRALLATPLANITAIDVTQAGRSARAERSGDAFTLKGHDDPAANEAARALAQTVATLRAITIVGYGEPTADQGFKAPFATLRIERTGTTPIEIVLGAATPNGDRYARRRDIPATLLLPASTVQALLAALS